MFTECQVLFLVVILATPPSQWHLGNEHPGDLRAMVRVRGVLSRKRLEISRVNGHRWADGSNCGVISPGNVTDAVCWWGHPLPCPKALGSLGALFSPPQWEECPLAPVTVACIAVVKYLNHKRHLVTIVIVSSLSLNTAALLCSHHCPFPQIAPLYSLNSGAQDTLQPEVFLLSLVATVSAGCRVDQGVVLAG